MQSCDFCVNNQTDETGERYCAYACDLDEDEMVHLMTRKDAGCPFFEPGDEYKIVQKQN